MAVERIIKYYVELRYSLMQLLYDAMFESSITGLPIARSMVSFLKTPGVGSSDTSHQASH